jgi:hypothetical protein
MGTRKRDEFAIAFALWYSNYRYKGFKTIEELLVIFKREKGL